MVRIGTSNAQDRNSVTRSWLLIGTFLTVSISSAVLGHGVSEGSSSAEAPYKVLASQGARTNFVIFNHSR